MEIVCVGLNHRTAPVKIRECLAFDQDQAAAALADLSLVPGIEESLIFSTCNRVEILAAGEDAAVLTSLIKTFLSKTKNIPLKDLEPVLYAHTGDEAVRHIFRVAASLDSMVLGEPQILGQIKDAFRLAATDHATAAILNRLMHRAFATAKRVRKETGIGGAAVSISFAAVELAKKIFGSLEEKKVLLIGAGEMAELAVEHLLSQQVGELFVANRTFERGVALATRFSGTPIRFEEIQGHLNIADIIISSTGARGLVLEKKHLKGVMRKRRNQPLFFIDIAVPRDIDPAINKVGNAYVYDIDDLAGVVENNRQERKKEAVRAERIVDESVIKFRLWLDSLDVVPTIVALKDKMESIRLSEMEKTLQSLKDLPARDREAIDRLTRAIVNKSLHDPIQFIKQDPHSKTKKREHLDVTRRMFDLND